MTGPLLDVLEVLLEHAGGREKPYGWVIMKAVGRSGPTVYGVLDRLEEWGWVTGTWEELSEDEGRPRRRCYEVTPTGRVRAEALLMQRNRPARGFTLFRSPVSDGAR
ncbi:Transcriptional regulator PadR-like family protein [Actinokineospora terrae]|uniref:Transcriptional regulator PadR-like family protein n=1 Tax=Actinokineospora terrae TaxID=155974 RepID=A0A1H9X826_9PSEU|nr:Transcriptional regulator PadR-like family protein [Actinokineospora terrae]